ncbi:hypothetical protein BYT27DRAFT_7256580 [Phlegmacium glaucopus]|nr:hypothetical protein BYT27DRAFT_7256580 [Phlegmacium glaucopus]
MSQHGETSTSNATLSSETVSSASNRSGLQSGVVDNCIDIVQQFRAGRVNKPKASLLLQQAIPHKTVDEETFISTYSSYLDMLDNFERYWTGNVQRVNASSQIIAGGESNEQQPSNEQPDPAAHAAISSKRPISLLSEEEDDEYAKRTRLDFNALPWHRVEDAETESFESISPSLQKTHALLENFSRDVKRARASLLNCNRTIPQFPPSEWLNLLSGNVVDLDHVFSNIYTISYSNKESIELGKNIEILHSPSTPAKTFRTHGDWVIAWDALADATCFVFDHRKHELQLYSKHIQRYFASLPAQYHLRVINYDRAVRIRVSQRRDLELSDFAQFDDLQIQWIHSPSNLMSSSQQTEPRTRQPIRKNDFGPR